MKLTRACPGTGEVPGAGHTLRLLDEVAFLERCKELCVLCGIAQMVFGGEEWADVVRDALSHRS